MKKLISLTLTAILLLSFTVLLTSCSSPSTTTTTVKNQPPKPQTTTLPPTIEDDTWSIAYYVDEFQNPTDEAYIRNSEVFIGVFSNSATTNSKLYARILIDAEDIAIKLWEYGSMEVNAYARTNYDITILDDSGTKHYMNGHMNKNGERIYISEQAAFASLLQSNEMLKIYIEEDSEYGYSTSYLFEMNRGNFKQVYSEFQRGLTH